MSGDLSPSGLKKHESCRDAQRHSQCVGEEEREVDVNAVGGAKMTRGSAMLFNVTDVKKPLASAVKIVEASNWVVMGPDGGYIKKYSQRGIDGPEKEDAALSSLTLFTRTARATSSWKHETSPKPIETSGAAARRWRSSRST